MQCYRSTRRLLWEELVNFSTSNVPWLVGGDINTILHFDGNQDGSLNKMGPMEDFNDGDGMYLIDVRFEGNHLHGPIEESGKD
ncbi:UNVERIFIED_CONTAM: hypothetical protein Sangu_1319300 [Sesamum angustifolium]|uniref:Endonuclease/exonuclease/phosphatase domain-containing protein n=1 Tax=Sesamum angustifolium TaxID=2727405 RepID=A0AAW2NNV6_9LAMI